MQIRSKVWFSIEGEQVFGKGKCEILKAVDRAGSINKAAAELGMSYRHAWSCIKSAELRLGQTLVIKARGGSNGGGAHLTEYAKELINKYERLNAEVIDFANSKFNDR